MSLDNIKLSPFLVKELYENSLTGIDTNPSVTTPVKKSASAKKTVPAASANDIRFLGENKKNILVLVNEQQHPFTSDDDLNFLINILRACNILMEDVALVNCFDNSLALYENLNTQFVPAYILFLGPEPQQLGFPMQIPQYRPLKYNNQQYLSAPALQKLSSDKDAKKELWTALKQMFSIS